MTKLSSRIRKGRAWLAVNSQSYCQEYGKPYRPEKWENSLKQYEKMVDECPVPEKECWDEEITVGEMEDYEVEFHLNPQVDKQTELL